MAYPTKQISWPIFLAALAILGVRVAMLLLPSVNQEFAFTDAAAYFHTGDTQLLDQFLFYQANTLGIPFLGWMVSHTDSSTTTLIALRLLASAGLVLLIDALIRVCRKLELKPNPWSFAIILLNPLIWIYSARATADFLPAAVAIWALSHALHQREINYYTFVAAMAFGIAGILKYHSLLLLIPAFLLQGKLDKNYKPLAFIAFAASCTVAVYIIFIYKWLGFFVTPTQFQHTHKIIITNLLENFIFYIGFLALLTMPNSIYSWQLYIKVKSHPVFFVLAFIIAFFLGSVVLTGHGEMGFGPLGSKLPANTSLMAMMAASLLFFYNYHVASKAIRDGNPFKARMMLSVLAIIAILSFSRPAQRYLISVIPLCVLALPQEFDKHKILTKITLSIFVMANLYISFSQIQTGTAATAMVQMLRSSDKISVTEPGALESHAGNVFWKNRQIESKFTVMEGFKNDAIMMSSSAIPWGAKQYSFIPIEKK